MNFNFFKKYAGKLAFLFAAAFFAGIPVFFAQAVPDIDLSHPTDMVSPENVSAVQVAITVLLAYLTSFLPKLRQYNGFVRAAAVSFVVVCSAISFKLGALNGDTVQLLFDTFLPNFAYSGALWETLKFLLRTFGIDVKKYMPSAPASTPVESPK